MTDQAGVSPSSLSLLAVITFAHPVMLAGLSAVLVPIAIHLIHRGLPRTLVFPTIRFLVAASASQSRVRRLRHLLLMILRCAFVALLAIAFARPLWFASAGAAAEANRDTAAVVLLDVSASMGYVESPASTMSQGLAQASAVVGSLDPARGDRLNIVLAGLSPEVLHAKPTSNLASMKAELEHVGATAERADVNGAMAVAVAQFAEFRPSRKELHIISDFQRTNWDDADFTALPADTKVILHRVGADAPRPNVCIAEVIVTPSQPIAGQPCQVTVRLANYSSKAERRDVSLRTNDGREWKRPGAALSPGVPTGVSFDVRFDTPGVCELTAEIASDGLAIDDRRFAAARVVARMPVLLCTDADLREGVTSGYLLARAIDPFDDGQGTIELRTVRGSELSAATLTGIDAVFLDASGPLSSAGVQALRDYLEEGGGVAVFLGFGAAAENLRALEALAKAGEHAAGITNPESRIRGETAHVVVNPAAVHPLLRPLGDAGIESLQGVSVYRHVPTSLSQESAQIIATLDTGDAALAAKPVGAGRLLVCSISPDPQWSDLAKHAVFPGLMQQCVSFLRPTQWVERPVYAGMSATRRWSATGPLQDVAIADPNGDAIRAALRYEGPSAMATLPAIPTPGFCRIRSGGKLVESIAVNVDPAESDLASVDLKAFEVRISTAGRRTSAPTASAEAMSTERHGRPLWHWAVGAGLLMLAVEMVCLMVWRR